MLFNCFPSRTKCEWAELQPFVDDHINTNPEKKYIRAACLDIEIRDQKVPEILLKAPGQIDIVIERKSIVCRPTYFSDHQNEHDLWKHVYDLIGDRFTDSVYQLTVSEESLVGKRARDVREMAEQIATIVQANQVAAMSQSGISSRRPIPWTFRQLHPFERDENVPDTGFGIQVLGESIGFMSEEPHDSDQRLKELKSGYTESFERASQDAAAKFKGYAECLKIFLVQFFGNGSLFLGDKDIIEIIESADLPNLIDQVWVAEQEWVSLSDYKIAWKHVR